MAKPPSTIRRPSPAGASGGPRTRPLPTGTPSEQFERYMAAHIARDQDNGESSRMVRDFIAELDGLSRSAKQKLVLEESGAARVKLAEFFERGTDAIGSLLEACQNQTRPP